MITSVQNQRVKQWKKLHTKKERERTNTFLIEGEHLVEEAIKSGWNVRTIIVHEGYRNSSLLSGEDPVIVSDHVFKHLSQTKTPQGIIAVLEMRKTLDIDQGPMLLVDRVQDPGNLGTMIRTADASGFSQVILGEGTVDLFNDKVIRATQGSIFHIFAREANLHEEVKRLKEKGYHIWATALLSAKVYDKIPVHENTAIIVGNEGSGVDQSLINQADEVVKIPIYGQAESLNVSVAAGILMYHVGRNLHNYE